MSWNRKLLSIVRSYVLHTISIPSSCGMKVFNITFMRKVDFATKYQVHLIIQFPLYYLFSGHLWELKCREKFRKIGHTTCFFLIASVKWYMKYFIYHNSICVPSLSFLRQSRKTKRKRWENIILSSGFYLYHLIITPSRSYCTMTFTDINRYA